MRDPTTENWKDSTLGVSCTPECPSDLALDALAVKECSPSETQTLMAHIAQCQACAARWELRQQGMAAFPNVDRDAIVAKLHQLSAQMPQEPEPSFWAQIRSVFQQPAVVGTSLAFGAILMMLMVKPPEEGPITDIKPDTVRAKGPSFTVFKNSNESVEILANGGKVQAGDKLRFKIKPQEGTEIMVVGQEAGGKLYMAFPMDGSEASRPSMASPGGILPGTIELDQSTGKEKLYLISCEHPFGLSNIEANIDDIIVPKRCVTSAFEINKVKP